MKTTSVRAQVHWYKGSLKLSDGERHSVVTVGSRHVLTINPVGWPDFGNYSCVSENSLGKARGPGTQVALTGECVVVRRPED